MTTLLCSLKLATGFPLRDTATVARRARTLAHCACVSENYSAAIEFRVRALAVRDGRDAFLVDGDGAAVADNWSAS